MNILDGFPYLSAAAGCYFCGSDAVNGEQHGLPIACNSITSARVPSGYTFETPSNVISATVLRR